MPRASPLTTTMPDSANRLLISFAKLFPTLVALRVPTTATLGLDSSGSGTKGSYLAKHFPTVLCPDFSGSLQERLGQLDALCADKDDLILNRTDRRRRIVRR